MTRRNDLLNEFHHPRIVVDRPLPPPVRPRHERPLDDEEELKAVAHDEGWFVPPKEVTRVALRPWQQAVFWGLRVYIVLMLVVMAIGFAHVAAG